MNRVELLAKLKDVSWALAETNFVPSMMCFCFTQNGTVRAFNDIVGVEAPCDLELDRGLAVHGRTLMGLLGALQGHNLEFGVAEKDLMLACDDSILALPWIREKEFSWDAPKQILFQSSWPVDHMQALEHCLTTVSADLTQESLTGVCVKREYFYSCDGDVITRSISGLGYDHTITLNYQFCKAMLALRTAINMFTVYDGWSSVHFGNEVRLTGRLLKNSNIDHEHLIKRTLKVEPTYILVPEGLLPAIERAMVVGDADSKPTAFTIEKGKLELKTVSPLGEVEDVLDVSKKHPTVTGAFSARKIRTALEMGVKEMALMDNSTSYRDEDKLFQLIGNMG